MVDTILDMAPILTVTRIATKDKPIRSGSRSFPLTTMEEVAGDSVVMVVRT
jgi:hypothetical protein